MGIQGTVLLRNEMLASPMRVAWHAAAAMGAREGRDNRPDPCCMPKGAA